MQEQVKKRYENIDFMKGICILLVVATHLDLPLLSHASFSLFRMPLYYFLSGIFFSRYDGFKTFLIKKTNNLLIPYIFFSLFTCLAIVVFYLGKDLSWQEAYTESGPLHNGPIWFLISLFEVGILMYFISAIKSNFIQILVVGITSYMGYYMCHHEIILPFYLNTALLGMAFYYAGILLRRYKILDDGLYLPVKFLAFLIVFLLIAFVIIPDRRLALITYEIPFPYYWFIAAGLCGTLSLFYLSKMVNKISIINYFGRYSIIVLGVHWYFVKSWKYVILPPTEDIHKGLFLYFIYIFALLASLACIVLMKKYLPWFTAQKPLIRLPQ